MKHLRLFARLMFVVGFFFFAWYLSKVVTARFSPSPVLSQTEKTAPVSLGVSPPTISAAQIFILDRRSGLVLLKNQSDQEIYPASTTKMMTALVAYKHFPLDAVIEVDKSYPEGVDISLQPGEILKVSDLLFAILVQSANDAAEVIAQGFPGGRTAFVAAMNSEAKRLNLHHTQFLNPTGLDEDGHFSSAADLARIADELLHYPYLARIVATENAVISSADYTSSHPLSNVNQLLGKVSGVVGIKTGFTDLAGQALVTLVNRNGHEVIISILGSTDRFNDTKLLIDWAYSAFSWPDPPPNTHNPPPERRQ